MAARKAQALSLSSLAKSVESAVKVAAARHSLALDKDTLVHRWEIIGRRLRDVADINVAYAFAEDVSRGVRLPGLKLEPIVTKIGRNIWVGFIERGLTPTVINR